MPEIMDKKWNKTIKPSIERWISSSNVDVCIMYRPKPTLKKPVPEVEYVSSTSCRKFVQSVKTIFVDSILESRGIREPTLKESLPGIPSHIEKEANAQVKRSVLSKAIKRYMKKTINKARDYYGMECLKPEFWPPGLPFKSPSTNKSSGMPPMDDSEMDLVIKAYNRWLEDKGDDNGPSDQHDTDQDDDNGPPVMSNGSSADQDDDNGPPVMSNGSSAGQDDDNGPPVMSNGSSADQDDDNRPPVMSNGSSEPPLVNIPRWKIPKDMSGEITVRKSAPRLYHGIVNNHQNCWLNASLQALKENVTNNVDADVLPPRSVQKAVFLMLGRLKAESPTVHDVEPLLNLMTRDRDFKEFKKGVQHDPSSFILTLLDRLSEDGVYEPAYISYNFLCGICHKVRLGNPESHPMLIVSMCNSASSLTELIGSYFQSSISTARCPKCRVECEHSTQASMLSSPSTLFLQLKRFHSETFQKLVVEINCDSVLEVQEMTFALKAVIVHHGNSTSVGHYITYVVKDDHVIQYDDLSCQKKSLEILNTRYTKVNGYIYIYERK